MWDFEKDSKHASTIWVIISQKVLQTKRKENSEDEDILKRKSVKKNGNGQNNYFIWNSLFSRFQTKL